MNIELPENWTASLGSGAQELVTSLFPVILFLGAIGLAFYIVGKILKLISPDHWFTEGGFEQDPSLTEEDKEYYREQLK